MVLVLLILWPLAEIFVAIEVAQQIGVLLMLLLLIAGWPIGSWVLRSRGRAAWRRLGDAVASGRSPGREVLNGALIVAGGMLLMIPGFISDAVALAALFPPSRALLRRVLEHNLRSRFVVYATQVGRQPEPYDVDSTARDVDPPQLRP
jgi:UPF0716 protein FxsA